MKIYQSYYDTPNGWRKTDSPRSPLNWVQWHEVIWAADAAQLGFRPAKPKDKGEFISAVTCEAKGFRGTSSRVYLSRWVKP